MKVGVFKFGGSSISNIGRINHVANLIAQSPYEKKVVVVSAMGDTTDYLLRLAKRCSPLPDKRELDMLLATGEQVSISLLAIKLKELGINAKAFTGPQLSIATDGSHTEARILDIDKNKFLNILEDCDTVVAAGFQGIDEKGEITTLGRGGSDTTAVAIACCLEADICEIYTDVDGVFTSDPNKVREVLLHEELSYEEALELTRAGAQVVHPRAVDLACEYGIELRVRNTFNPGHQGTLIRRIDKMEKPGKVISIAVSDNEACIRLSKLESDSSIFDSISQVVDRYDLTVHSIAESVDKDAGVKELELYVGYVDKERLDQAVESLKNLTKARECKTDVQLSKLSIIGRALTRSTLTKLLAVLKEANIPFKQIEVSENRISCLIENIQSSIASTVVHSTFNEVADVRASVA